MTADSDYIETIVEKWGEMHKKSMLLLMCLVAVKKQPMYSGDIANWITDVSGWSLTERGLHRTLKRMEGLDLLSSHRKPSPKGPDRKVYTLTDTGDRVLEQMKATTLSYAKNRQFLDALGK